MTAVEIPLRGGQVAIVDAADADRVLGYRWCARKNGRNTYALRQVQQNGKRTTVLMHKFLTGYERTDHRNGNGLDNRRSNLREVTTGENIRNSRRRVDNRTGYKGVGWNKNAGKWRASIAVNGGRSQHLGYYLTGEEAARAYDTAARELHGEYAALNFPLPGERAA